MKRKRQIGSRDSLNIYFNIIVTIDTHKLFIYAQQNKENGKIGILLGRWQSMRILSPPSFADTPR